jgi:hypothetical protein
MVGWIVQGVAVVAMLLLIWWSARGTDHGPRDEMARKFGQRGGPTGL